LEKTVNITPVIDIQDLMAIKVYEILLVASHYDAYIIEEDGRLTEQIIHEYMGMNFNYAPRVWRAGSAREALKMFKKRNFDMVISMVRTGEMDPITFGAKIKKIYPKKPVIILAYDESELRYLPNPIPPKTIDKVFIWMGNANVFPAIIKYVEDKYNASRDILKGGVRAIVFIEDNPRTFSVILPLIYKEIMFHAKNLSEKSLSDSSRLLHLRGRPKILLASSFEEAEKYFKKYTVNILGVISDIRFPHGNMIDPLAGIQFAKYARSIDPSIPIILQSTDETYRTLAEEIPAHFLHKDSQSLLNDLRKLILKNFGFGEFIFKDLEGNEIDRSNNLISFLEAIKKAPSETINYHGASNHFSNWLAARGEFQVATMIRVKKWNDFDTIDGLKNFLIDHLQATIDKKTKGKVIEFFHESYSTTTNFSRLASGSLGGKARGLAFANLMLADSDIESKFPGIKIRIPRTSVIGTDEFDWFMEKNDLWDFATSKVPDDKIRKTFINAELSKKLLNNLQLFLKNIKYPIAVRSSSLMEDSHYQPLSGLYSTFMLPNNSSNDSIRLHQLINAIKLIYASTFFREPKSIFNSTALKYEQEKMGIAIMELSGSKYGNYFYPTLSGSAQSVNYYPISYMKREDGIVNLALGLGRTVSEGGKALRFCPRYPKIIPQFDSVKGTIQNSQNNFYAMPLDESTDLLASGEQGNLVSLDLQKAEDHGSLLWAGSTLVSDDYVIRDSLRYKGARIVTFAPILKHKLFPLPKILEKLIKLGKDSMGCPVELEFSAILSDDPSVELEFNLLQIKPMTLTAPPQTDYQPAINSKDILIQSTVALGNGTMDDIFDIILVDLDKFDSSYTVKIASEIESFNKQLGPDRPYILIGTGRWGSADPWLGIPVNWNQISNAKVIVEVGLPNFPVDPSFGSHFFQNVTSLRVGYFTLNHKNPDDLIFLNSLGLSKPDGVKEFTKWYSFKKPVIVKINGQSGEGIIFKPNYSDPEISMDEQESSGI